MRSWVVGALDSPGPLRVLCVGAELSGTAVAADESHRQEAVYSELSSWLLTRYLVYELVYDVKS